MVREDLSQKYDKVAFSLLASKGFWILDLTSRGFGLRRSSGKGSLRSCCTSSEVKTYGVVTFCITLHSSREWRKNSPKCYQNDTSKHQKVPKSTNKRPNSCKKVVKHAHSQLVTRSTDNSSGERVSPSPTSSHISINIDRHLFFIFSSSINIDRHLFFIVFATETSYFFSNWILSKK